MKIFRATILSGTLRESAIYTCEYYYNCEESSEDLKKMIISTFQFLCIYIDFGGLVTLPSEYTKNLGEVLLRLAGSFFILDYFHSTNVLIFGFLTVKKSIFMMIKWILVKDL